MRAGHPRARYLPLSSLLFATLTCAWGAMLATTPTPTYPETPFRGYIAASSLVAALGIATAIRAESSNWMRRNAYVGNVLASWGSVHIGLAACGPESVGGLAIGAIAAGALALAVVHWASSLRGPRDGALA